MILVFLGLLALGLLIVGFALKKSWILWMAIPFWWILALYMAYQEYWFPAQHFLVLIGVGATIGLGYSAIRMQSKPITPPTENDT